MIEFGVLGPVLLQRDGAQLLLHAHVLRRLLAVLLCQPMRPVPVADLADALWNDPPRARVARTLPVYVHRLRRAIGDGGDRVSYDSGGYRISVAADELDALRFADLASRGLTAHRRGDLGEARSRFDEALGLWRGVPYADVAANHLIAAEARRLEEQRLVTHQDRIAVDLDLGHHVRPISELTLLTSTHPYREQLRGLLMLALHRAGRQTEALRVFRDTRTLLADELGVEPDQSLQRLHAAILRADERLAYVAAGSLAGEWEPAPSRPVELASGATSTPQQLPGDTAGFVGRAEELETLDRLLPGTRPGGRAPVISTITGTPGVGKTALAIHWAHRAVEWFPDGQLYVDLRGFDPGRPPMEPSEAIRSLLDSLEVAPNQIPTDPDAQAGRYRSLLADRRMLLLLDNARDAEQVQPLLPGTPGCLAVVTSRDQLTALVAANGAEPLALDLFTHQEAFELLEQRLGTKRPGAEPDAVDEIIVGCARLPMALAIVAARIAPHPHLEIRTLVRELQDAGAGLDALSLDLAVNVRAAFDVSYRTLSTDAARLFRLLGLHPGPEVSPLAAASLSGPPSTRVRRPLTELARAHLIDEQTDGRYRLHGLLHSYAVELVHTYDTESVRRTAKHRTFDYYLHAAHAAALSIAPHRQPLPLGPPEPGTAVPAIEDHRQACDWFSAEYESLRSVIADAGQTGFDSHCWQLAWAVSAFSGRRGRWRDQLADQQAALAASGRVGDRIGQANANRLLGEAHARLCEYSPAQLRLQSALDTFHEIGDRTGQAVTHTSLGRVCTRQVRYRDALEHARAALALYRAAGHQGAQASALNNLAVAYGLLGDHRQSLTYGQQALELYGRTGNCSGRAAAWDTLGRAHHRLGDHRHAVRCYQHALDLYQDGEALYYQAEVMGNLGEARHSAGDLDGAREALRAAVNILERLEHPDAEQARNRLEQVVPPPQSGNA